MKQSDKENTSLAAGMYGYVVADASGAFIEEQGNATQSLKEYVAYFNQLSNLIGDSLGFDATEELVIFGKKNNAICMEIDELHYAAIFKSKSDYREVSEFLQAKGEENNVFA